MDLARRSIEIITANQAESGAYIAGPNFGPYQYCWFRDGAYCAHALDLWGESTSSTRFFHWSSEVILSRENRLVAAIERARDGQPLEEDMILHTRYTVEGRPVKEMPWSNFQLDGLGTWLWALQQHARLTEVDELPEEMRRAAESLSGYLVALWSVPCYDVWEEADRRLHIYTLASIWAGLQAWKRLNDQIPIQIVDQIRQFVLHNGVLDGAFIRSVGDARIDASLLGVAFPSTIVPLDDSRLVRTVKRIEEQLRRGQGVHRNLQDTYYGGGAWLLLSAWLAKYHLDCGRLGRAEPLLDWVEQQANERGWLPEQIPQNMNEPSYLEPWRGFWGDIASPLLWSHAKYLIAKKTHEGRS